MIYFGLFGLTQNSEWSPKYQILMEYGSNKESAFFLFDGKNIL
jgi:hypothetical protein